MFKLRFAVFFTVTCCTLRAETANGLGDTHFATSCRSEVQGEFDRAIALLHSFEFTEAQKAFRDVEHRDPQCPIAAWGVALAQTQRVGANASAKWLATGWAELQPWFAVKPGTPREQMYIDAVRSMYEGYDHISGQERWNRYLQEMNSIRKQFPDDLNGSMFYALGLVWTAGSGPEGLRQRRNSLDILLPIFATRPNNPGAAHYIIHAADTPELAATALPAARKYASIAPDSPHALHMPSHIFGRLGYWNELIASNKRSASAAAEWVASGKDGRFDELHALTYLEYGFLQMGKLDDAREQITRIRDLMAGPGGDPWAEIDARVLYDVQTRDWRDALLTQPPTGSPVKENFDVYWVHAIAAANIGNIDSAKESLRQLSDSVAQHKTAAYDGILHLDLVQTTAALDAAMGKSEEAITTLKDAVRYEQQHPVDYPNVLTPPSAELLGTLLLTLHRRSEATLAFQTAVELAPNTLHSIEGTKEAASGIHAER
jgi:tetratricopeptide (TPR) repeat protein